MATPIVTTRILRRLLSSGVHGRAERLLSRMHPADLGPLLSSLTPDETRIVIDMLFRLRRAASTLRELPPELLPQIYDAVSDERIAAVLARLEVETAQYRSVAVLEVDALNDKHGHRLHRYLTTVPQQE